MNAAASNRLLSSSSPYLRMHAGNPVHWQPWDDAALAAARDTDTPILLSIGYSACHWCHVMARECFEDPDIAEAMNHSFVNIKLDREERPDIDRVYQLAHQALNGRGGGWPLTVFLDPTNLTPFFTGTYFPPSPRHGLPGFPEVLARVRAYFDRHRDELRDQSGTLRQWLQHAQDLVPGSAVDPNAVAAEALRRIARRADREWGGDRGGPKFPRAAELEWLLDTGDDDARAMACHTLSMMARRGLQDHLGGGFFRYCVDAEWTIPHFEKMLYDNAQLLPLYQRAVAIADDPALRDEAAAASRGIVDWLAREMTAPDHTLYSALGADSEGGEGNFYLWTREQVQAVLPAELAGVAEAAYGLDGPPNFEQRAWHLLRATPLDEVAARCDEPPAATAGHLADARQRLFAARETRPRPARDDKVLTAWNALAVAGLARSARMTGDPGHAEQAVRLLDGLRQATWIDDRLYANAAAAGSRVRGFLDDHALLLDALLEVLQLGFTPRDLDWAIALADALCRDFADYQAGGFWFSTNSHATPLSRGRSWTDESLPNGSAVAIRSLLRLGHLLGNDHYLEVATRALRAAAGALNRFPDACPSLLRALAESEHPRPLVVVRCPWRREPAWRKALDEGLRAARIVPGSDPVDAFFIATNVDDLPGLLEQRRVVHHGGTAYLCEGSACQAPLGSPKGLADSLRALRRH